MRPGGALEEQVRTTGRALGLDLVGFADPAPHERTEFLREWVARGFAGEMDYIERRIEERVDPRLVLPGARSLIVAGLGCAAPAGSPNNAERAADAELRPVGRIARYAGGDDYHEVLLDRVRALAAALEPLAGRPVTSRAYVDTGPVIERAAAERAGLGWIGKNSCLINPEIGSHMMLGVILCDLDLAPDPGGADHCGTCRACLDACPTDAFPEPYVLDATRCISYTTIEARSGIPEALRSGQGEHVFGCDVCQDVCPWNRSRPRQPHADPLGLRSRLAPRAVWQEPTLEWILGLDEDEFLVAARRTALRRTGHRGLLRNALIAAGNAAGPGLREAVSRHVESDDPVLAEHARWALDRIDGA